MRRLPLFALALLSACAHEQAASTQPAARVQPPPQAPALPPAPFRLPESVKPSGYELELTIDPAADRFSGRERIDVRMTGAPNVLWLHSRDQDLTAATLVAGDVRTPLTVTRATEDLIALTSGTGFVDGAAALELEWRAPFNDRDAQGLFRYRNGSDAYALTQFEPLDARRAFPSFDEPGFKVPFKLSLVVPEKLQAFANMPEARRAPAERPGFVRVEFQKTPPLPTYLVAFAVGPFEVVDGGTAGKNGTPIRVIVTRGHSNGAAFAVKEIPRVLAALEAYFGTPYPYPKLDSLEIPITGAFFGAMENVGLVTFSGALLVGDPAHDGLERQRQFSDVAAHEFAHQWFGDLVTPRWWDDIWLNESFASWMSTKIVDQVHPDWRFGLERVNVLGHAIRADSLLSARQIRQPANAEGDILNAFDGITYSKGASVLAMFEHQVGEERFREGVRRYVAAHAHGTATATDFLASLSAAGGADVAGAFETFIAQPGVPEIRFDLVCERGQRPRVDVTQQRYVPLGVAAPAAQTWRVPVCVRYPEGAACTELTSSRGRLTLEKAKGCPSWIAPNDGAYGYYVARLSAPLFEGLLMARPGPLTTAEQVRWVADAAALLRDAGLPAAEALALISRLVPKADRQVVDVAGEVVTEMSAQLAEGGLEAPFARWVDRTFSARMRALGIEPRKGDTEEDRLLRPRLLFLTGVVGENPDVRRQVLEAVWPWLEGKAPLDPDLFGVYLTVVARRADPALHRVLRERLLKTSAPEERREILQALGAARHPQAIRENLEFALLGKELDPNEGISVVFSGGGGAQSRETRWRWITEHYDALAARLSAQTMAFTPFMGAGFCDVRHLDEVKTFFAPKVAKLPGGQRVLAQALERVQQCTRIRAAQRESLAGFLGAAARTPSASPAPRSARHSR